MGFSFPEYRIGRETPQGFLPTQQINAPLEAFGGGAGERLRQAGADLQQAANAQMRMFDRQMDLENEAEAKTADTNFANDVRGLLFDPEKGYFAKRGKGAIDSAKPTLEEIQKVRDRHASTIKSPAALRAFDMATKARVAAIDDQVSRHVIGERKTWVDQASTARQQSLVEDIGGAINDPKLLGQMIVGLQNEAVQASLDRGEAPVVAIEKGREARSMGVKVAILSKMQRDPIGAKSFFDQNIGFLTAQDRITLEHQLDQRVSQSRGASVNLLLTSIATGQGVPYNFKIAGYESGKEGPAAKNPDSGAGGRYQFTDQTWLANARKFLPETAGMSDAQVLQMRTDDKAGETVFAGFTKDNEAELAKADIPVSDTTRYLAHWFGAKGATQILKADASTPIENFLPAGKTPTGKTWAQANGIAGKTAGEVVTLAQRRMGEGGQKGAAPGGVNLNTMVQMAMQAAGPRPEDQAKAVENALQAYRASVEMASKAQAAAEHDIKKRGEEAEKALTDLGNGVTESDVRKYRDVLSNTAYGVWMQKARGEDAVDEPTLVTGLQMRADKEDIEKELYEARRNRHMSQGTFDKLLEMNRRYMRDDQPGSPFKSGREFVKNLLDPGILTDPAAMAIGRVAQAKAVAEFDQWVLDNKGADRKATMEAAESVARRYATVQTADLSIALPVPRFYPDQTKQRMQEDQPAIVEQKLRQTATSIRQELEAGRLTQDEAAKEFKNIEQWLAIQKRRATQTPPPKGK